VYHGGWKSRSLAVNCSAILTDKMHKEELNKLRNQLSVESKNGIDFTTAAAIIWAIIAFIWNGEWGSYNKSILVFIAGAALLPLAFMFSKIYKTNWKVRDNPLQPLGLWLNFAQLFYFPFLVFVLVKSPDYFIMTYSIITGAHFFPYSWFYKTKWYAAFAGIISVGSLLIAINNEYEKFFYIGIFMSICLLILTLGLLIDFNKKNKI
jgi:hypothetical protein